MQVLSHVSPTLYMYSLLLRSIYNELNFLKKTTTQTKHWNEDLKLFLPSCTWYRIYNLWTFYSRHSKIGSWFFFHHVVEDLYRSTTIRSWAYRMLWIDHYLWIPASLTTREAHQERNHEEKRGRERARKRESEYRSCSHHQVHRSSLCTVLRVNTRVCSICCNNQKEKKK